MAGGLRVKRSLSLSEVEADAGLGRLLTLGDIIVVHGRHMRVTFIDVKRDILIAED